jgi:hypothetical protein
VSEGRVAQKGRGRAKVSRERANVGASTARDVGGRLGVG